MNSLHEIPGAIDAHQDLASMPVDDGPMRPE